MDLSNKEKELMETLYEMGGSVNITELMVKLKRKTKDTWGMPAMMTLVARLERNKMVSFTGRGYQMRVKAVHPKEVYEALTK